MLKKTITYVDFNDETATEEFYFNLTKAELIEMELSEKGGLSATFEEIYNTKDGAKIMATFKGIILKAIGQRSEDGRRFVKNDEIRADFESSEAYSTLFIELVTDADAAATFIKAIIPSDLAAEIEKDAEPLAYITEGRKPTQAELESMTQEQLREAFANREANRE